AFLTLILYNVVLVSFSPSFGFWVPFGQTEQGFRGSAKLWLASGTGLPSAVSTSSEERIAIQRVGVVECGLMSSGIAQVCAAAGFSTVVREVSQELVDKGLKGIDKNLARLAEKGTITAAVQGEIRGRLKGTTSVDDLKDCDLIVEPIIENLRAKHELFRALDAIGPPNTIFASNTSSLTITEIAAATKRPQRFVGLHFFNPVPVMRLVEVVRTIATDSGVYDEMVAFGVK